MCKYYNICRRLRASFGISSLHIYLRILGIEPKTAGLCSKWLYLLSHLTGKFSLHFCVYICVYMWHMGVSWYMCGGRGQAVGVTSVFPWCGFLGSNSGRQTWQQAPFPAKPSSASIIKILWENEQLHILMKMLSMHIDSKMHSDFRGCNVWEIIYLRN